MLFVQTSRAPQQGDRARPETDGGATAPGDYGDDYGPDFGPNFGEAQVQTPVRRPGRAWVGVVLVCIAALLAAAGIWTWRQEPFAGDSVRAGRSLGPNTSGSRGSSEQSAAAAGEAQLPQGVPATFRTWSVSNAGSGTLYNLGSTECGSDICPTLLRSGADGSSWQAVHIFSGTDTSSATGTDIPTVQPDGAVSQVRFADSQVGYVYGGDLWLTTDRGASFAQVNHPGQTVLDLEIWAGQIYLLSADGCVQGLCSGPLYVSFANRANPSAFTMIDSTPVRRAIDDASLVVKDALVVVQTGRGGRPAAQPWTLVGEDLKVMSGPVVCGGNPLEAVTITADTNSDLMALCRRDEDANAFRVLVRAKDGGDWVERSSGTLRLPPMGQLSLAAADPEHLLVSVGGPRGGTSAGNDARHTLQVSTDGGATWTVPDIPDSPPVNGFDWTGSPGGAEFYAVPRTTPGYWASADFGRTWKVVLPTP